MAGDVTALDLEYALGSSTYVAIFADSGRDVANMDAVALILRQAKADVKRYTLRGYDGLHDDPLTDELWSLQLDFAKARAYMRGDAYVRETGTSLFLAAQKVAEAIAEGLQRGSVAQPNPTCAVSPPSPPPGACAAQPLNFILAEREGEEAAGRAI